MKRCFIVVAFVAVASVSYAETYKWEDSKGIHYSDNASAVPEQHRSESVEPANEAVTPAPRVVMPSQSYSIPYQNNLIVNEQANAATEELKKRQEAYIAQAQRNAAIAKANAAIAQKKAVNAQNIALGRLSLFMVTMMIFGALIFVGWVYALIDIMKNDFSNPTNKIVWLLLVVLIPLLGMFLYFLIGQSQKKNYGCRDPQLIARLRPR